MIVRDLVKQLDKVNGVLPVKLLREGKVIDIREGYYFDARFNMFELTAGNIDRIRGDRELDTLFLMYIIDYCNEIIGGSLFNDESDRFINYMISVNDLVDVDKNRQEIYFCSDLKAYIRNFDGETCFVIEANDIFDDDEYDEENESIVCIEE